MTKISDFSTAVQASFDRINAAIGGLQGDIQNLNTQIAALQNSTGGLSPADQAILDQIQGTAQAAADKLSALDALTPPVSAGDGGEPATDDVGSGEGAGETTPESL